MNKLISGSGLLAVAALLGLITAGAALTWLTSVSNSRDANTSERARSVVVAKMPVPAGTALSASMLEIRAVPEADILPGTPSELSAAVGKTTRYPLVAGEQVSSSKLVSSRAADSEGLAFSVPPGLRAVAVPINEVRGAGGLIVPGDRVDVMVHTDYQRLFAPTDAQAVNKDDKRQPTVLTLLQDMLVIAVAQSTTPAIDGERDKATLRPEDASAQPTAKSVTLAVTPAQAQVLFFAVQEGEIGLSLRSFGDDRSVTLGPQLLLESQSGTANTAAAAPAPAPNTTR